MIMKTRGYIITEKHSTDSGVTHTEVAKLHLFVRVRLNPAEHARKFPNSLGLTDFRRIQQLNYPYLLYRLKINKFDIVSLIKQKKSLGY